LLGGVEEESRLHVAIPSLSQSSGADLRSQMRLIMLHLLGERTRLWSYAQKGKLRQKQEIVTKKGGGETFRIVVSRFTK
jgi:hypothetical protein